MAAAASRQDWRTSRVWACGADPVQRDRQQEDERRVVPNRFRPMTVTNGAWNRLSSQTPWSKMAMSKPGVP